jgi:hypothetical protein
MSSLAEIDLLARLQLDARRRGFVVRLCRVPEDLRDLIVLAGLDEPLGLEPRREPEEREERLRVEEERELDDPTS